MCKGGEAQRLFNLPYSGMEGYIEDELDLRARTADPLASPYYHKILYSWLTRRVDHRKGESISKGSTPEILLTCRAYSGIDHVPVRGTCEKPHGKKLGGLSITSSVALAQSPDRLQQSLFG
jgi:hypothetical protein